MTPRPIDRRAFLGSAGLVVTAAVALPAADRLSPRPRQARLVRSTFAPLAGDSLVATGAGTRTRLRLDEVADLLGAPAGSEHGFVLRFGSTTPLADGIYTIAHPRFGTTELFLGGVDRGASRRYEAVVNRTRTA
jgi:hypothetical protein